MNKWILIFLSVLAINPVNAETRYVMDMIYIGVRENPDDVSNQIAVIKSGAKLEVLDTLDENIQVRTEKGEVGWVKARYLTSEPIAAELLERANGRLESLANANSRYKEEVSDLKERLKQFENENRTMSKSLEKVSKENDRISEIAKKPLELSRQTQELTDQVESLTAQVKNLTAENAKLNDASGQDWFLAGAGVVIAGIIVGLVVPRMRLRRRSEWA